MIRFRISVIFVAAFSIDCGNCVFAGPLANHPSAFNDGNGPAEGAWSGIGTYSHPFAGDHLEGTIEWAVFGPDQFPYAGLNDWLPEPGRLTYAYQIVNTGSDGIADFSFQGAPMGVGNAGASALGGANETPLYSTFTDSGFVNYQFAYYDDFEEQTVGTPVPASTGISTGLVVSSSRLPINGPGNPHSYEGSLYPFIIPVIAVPGGSMYVPPSVPGDYNGNGAVDAADYTVWRNNLGAAAGTLPNDIDGGPIGSAQYTTWKAHYGESAGEGAGVPAYVAVPEPNSLILLMAAILVGSLPARYRGD